MTYIKAQVLITSYYKILSHHKTIKNLFTSCHSTLNNRQYYMENNTHSHLIDAECTRAATKVNSIIRKLYDVYSTLHVHVMFSNSCYAITIATASS